MPDWDKDRPDGTEPWNVGDDRIRLNFEFLELFLQAVSTFAINPANPTDRAATKLTFGLFAARPVTTVAAQSGISYFAIDTGRLFFCTDGATNTWSEQNSFNALAVAATLNVVGATTLAALTTSGALLALGGITIAAAGNLTLGSGRKIDLPDPAENWLKQGADNMNVHAHGARHRPGHTDGAWTTPNDSIPYQIQRIVGPSGTENAGVDIPSAAFAAQNFAGDRRSHLDVNTTGRPAATSRFLVYCEATVYCDGGDPDNQSVEIGLFLDAMASQQGLSAYAAWDASTPAGNPLKTISFWRYVTGVSAAAHTFTLHMKDPAAGGSTFRVYQASILAIDLGIA